MLGQHPALYALPETHLLEHETMNEWSNACLHSTYPMDHGLLRSVAELVFGGQTDETIGEARGWLRRRLHLSTSYLLELLACHIQPARLVEKSPGIVYDVKNLQRTRACFPRAHFIHLVRHPRSYGESVLRLLGECEKRGPVSRSHWLYQLATWSGTSVDGATISNEVPLDPQRAWLALHETICEFLRRVPETHRMVLRGEDVLANPRETLQHVGRWLGVSTDSSALVRMEHPERSPFATLGPTLARYGNDPLFLESPKLRQPPVIEDALAEPVSWLRGGALLPTVQDLARRLGYE
jgi:sulfotransferase family protein